MSDEASGSTATADRVVLYVRAGCHLCEVARDLVAGLAQEGGTGWREVDIDASDDPTLARRYGELVPVVTVDGVQQGYWRLDADRLRRALTAGGG
jgi:glutaredoxin